MLQQQTTSTATVPPQSLDDTIKEIVSVLAPETESNQRHGEGLEGVFRLEVALDMARSTPRYDILIQSIGAILQDTGTLVPDRAVAADVQNALIFFVEMKRLAVFDDKIHALAVRTDLTNGSVLSHTLNRFVQGRKFLEWQNLQRSKLSQAEEKIPTASRSEDLGTGT